MATYTNSNLPTKLKFGDRVIFDVGDKTFHYHVSSGWLHNDGPEQNCAIFDELGLNAEAFCEKFYGFRAQGSWPDCNRHPDWKAILTNCVLGLYGVIASKGYKNPEPKPTCPEDMQPIVDAVNAGSWGCHTESVRKLVSAIVKHDLSPFFE